MKLNRTISILLILALLCAVLTGCAANAKEYEQEDFVLITDVIPDAILEIRYYSTFNFVGERIDAYEAPVAYLTKEAAEALKNVSDDLMAQGYRIKIYDADSGSTGNHCCNLFCNLRFYYLQVLFEFSKS